MAIIHSLNKDQQKGGMNFDHTHFFKEREMTNTHTESEKRGIFNITKKPCKKHTSEVHLSSYLVFFDM